MTVSVLILHGLLSVALLGAITHQSVSLLGLRSNVGKGFLNHYTQVKAKRFSGAVAVLYILSVIVGAWLYPEYRLESRYALEEMGLTLPVGAFELKEHWAALGLAALPAYLSGWREHASPTRGIRVLTWLLCLIVWFNFLVGHVLNNFRGLGA